VARGEVVRMQGGTPRLERRRFHKKRWVTRCLAACARDRTHNAHHGAPYRT
jgi:hypothetical protein